LAIIILHAITGVCTPACLLAASISVEAVTPPLVGLAIKYRELDPSGLTLDRSGFQAKNKFQKSLESITYSP